MLPTRLFLNTKNKSTARNDYADFADVIADRNIITGNGITTPITKIFVNFSHLAFGEFASKAFGFLTTVYLARTLGAEGFGKYSWVMAVYSYLYLFANFGFDTFGIRKIAATNQTDVINGVFVLRGVYVFLLILIVLLINFFALGEPNYLLLLQTASLLILPFNVQYVFRALGKGKYDGTYRTVQAGLFFFLVYLVILSDHILLIPLLWFISSASVSIGAVVVLTKMIPYNFSFPSRDTLGMIFRESVPIGIAGALILFYLNFDMLILGVYVDAHALGLYSAAFKIYYMGYTVLGLFYVAYLPSLSKTDSADFSIVRSSYKKVLFQLTVVIAIIGTLSAGIVVQILFGETYVEAVPVLKILMLSLAAACINFAFMNPLQAMGKDALFIKLLSSRTIIFMILCFILIPTYGIKGAAYATLIAEGVTIVTSLVVHSGKVKMLF